MQEKKKKKKICHNWLEAASVAIFLFFFLFGTEQQGNEQQARVSGCISACVRPGRPTARRLLSLLYGDLEKL